MIFKLSKKTDPKIIDLIYPDLSLTEKEKLIERVLKHYNLNGFSHMKVGDFLDCCNGEFSTFFEMKKANSFDYIFVLAFKEFIDSFAAQMENLQVPDYLLSDEQKNISKKIPTLSFNENVLIFCKEYFNLQNFEDGAELKLFEFILAKKAKYNSELAEALSIYTHKINIKSK